MYQGMGRSPRLRLEIVPAVGLVIAAFLPFGSWILSANATTPYYLLSISISLLDLLNAQFDTLGGLLIAVGGATACVTAVYRTAHGWPGSASAAVGLIGFLVFGAGVLAMAAQWSTLFSGTDTSYLGLSAEMSSGFWVELGFAGVGAAICAFNLMRPIGSPDAAGAQQYWPGGAGGWTNGWPGAWSAPQPLPGQQFAGQPGWPPYAQPEPAQSWSAQSWPAQPVGLIKARLTLTQGMNNSTTEVSVGQTVIVGSDPAADVVVSELSASPRQLSLTLTSAGWTIQPLDPANPAHLWDSAGMSGMLHGEAHVMAGQLQIGMSQIALEPPTAA